MSAEIKVPTLGESVTSATIARWLKQPGESVSVDEPVVELETDKASVEVAAPSAGVLGDHAASEGDDVAVGALLATVEEGAGEEGGGKPAPKPQAKSAAKPAPKPAPKAEAKAETPGTDLPVTETPVTGSGAPAPVTPAREAAKPAPGINAPPRASGPVSRPATPPADQARDGGASPSSLGSPPAFPSAAKLMRENDVGADAIGAGSGKGGRVTKGDVLSFLGQGTAPRPAAASAPKPPRADDPRDERVKMTRLRSTIAARLKEAQATAAILTTFNEVDMSAAQALRAEFRERFDKRHGVKLGYMSIFARAVIAALREFPALNAELDGDEIVYRSYVNLGIAVGAEQGLVVPVLRDAQDLGFAEIEKRVAELGRRARDGKLGLDDLTGGTFSITNGGIFGSLMSTPILNAPQSGILGMHKIVDRPVAIDGRVEIRPMMYLALSYDHRIVDGRGAVGFLVRVKELVEDPRGLLLDL